MDDGKRVPPDPQETFLTEIAQNQVAPLWEIYQTLVNEEPNRVPPPGPSLKLSALARRDSCG